MNRSVDIIVASHQAIERIINSPSKKPTREQAQKTLQACGIMDENFKVKPAYRTILVYSEKKNEDKDAFVGG